MDNVSEYAKERIAAPRSTVDNALTAAFRLVFGWCPFRDGCPPGVGIVCPVSHDRGGGHYVSPIAEVKKPLPKPPHISADPFVLGAIR